MNHIRIYHNILEMNLPHNDLRTLCGILRFTNTSTNYANVCKRKIARAANLSVSAVSRGIEGLAKRGLITVVRKSHNGHRLANGYIVTRQDGQYTMLPYKALALPVTPCGFKLYVFLLKCAGAGMRAFPSLSQISKAVGCTVKTAIAQIKALARCLAICKRNFIRRDGGYGHNRYTLLRRILTKTQMELEVKEKARPSTGVPTPHNKNKKQNVIATISQIFSVVKGAVRNFLGNLKIKLWGVL